MNPGLEAARAAREASRAEVPPSHPPGTGRLPLAGFPGYAIDRDRVVWICRGHGGWPCPWRPLSIVMRGRRSTRACVRLTDAGGRQVFRSVASLHRAAFLRPQLPADPILPERLDDAGDGQADAELGAPAPRRSPTPRSFPPVPPLPARRSQPATLDDFHDSPLPSAETLTRTLAPLARPPHPGGPEELGPTARGSEHGRAKLDEDLVVEMRRLRSEGWSTPSLSRRFGVGRNTVCYALSGATWGHVPGAIRKRGDDALPMDGA